MVYGITGGIGSGKSFVCRQIEAAGFPVFYCDPEAKRLIREDATVRRALTSLVGPAVYNAEGRLCKRVLSAFLCRGKAEAAAVDAIVHPRVRDSFINWVAARRDSSPHLFMECALLFEAAFDRLVEKSVLVYAPDEVRIRRIMARDGISREKALAWMALQMPEEEKRRRADIVLLNDGSQPVKLDALLA